MSVDNPTGQHPGHDKQIRISAGRAIHKAVHVRQRRQSRSDAILHGSGRLDHVRVCKSCPTPNSSFRFQRCLRLGVAIPSFAIERALESLRSLQSISTARKDLPSARSPLVVNSAHSRPLKASRPRPRHRPPFRAAPPSSRSPQRSCASSPWLPRHGRPRRAPGSLWRVLAAL